jgi:Pectate lyase superfamily protein
VKLFWVLSIIELTACGGNLNLSTQSQGIAAPAVRTQMVAAAVETSNDIPSSPSSSVQAGTDVGNAAVFSDTVQRQLRVSQQFSAAASTVSSVISQLPPFPSVTDGVQGVVSVASFGAKGDGITDDTAAISTAFASMGRRPIGRLFFPPGLYRVTSTLNFDLGYDHLSPGDAPTNGGFELDMQGSLRPDAGIGIAMHIYNGYYPILKFKVDGGGQCSTFTTHCNDIALSIDHVTQSFIPSINGKDYAGTLFSSIGTGGASSNGLSASTVASLICSYCGQVLDIESLNGFGRILHAEDNGSVHGWVLKNAYDVGLDLQNSGNGDLACTGSIIDSGSIHLGTMALSGYSGSGSELCISSSDRVTLLDGHFIGDGSNSYTGLSVSGNSIVSAGTISCDGVKGNCIQNDCASVTVANLYSELGDTHHYVQGCSSGGTAFGRLGVNTSASSGSGYMIQNSEGSGALYLTGQNAADNSGSNAAFDVENRSPGTYLYLLGFMDYDPSHAMTVGTVGVSDPTKLFIDGVSSLSSFAWTTDGKQLTRKATGGYGGQPVNAGAVPPVISTNTSS